MSQKEILETLSRFQKAKGTEYHIRRIGVFGSTARNQMTDTSDIDVVVELSVPDLYILIGIKQDLEDLLKRSVDIVRYRETMNDFLKQRIEQEAIYV
jgi:predicted nucleotidyltransferase